MDGSEFFEAHMISRNFNDAMANYVPSVQDEEAADAAVATATRNNAAAEQEILRRRKRRKQEADLSKAPKMFSTAYAFFAEEQRNLLRSVNPKSTFGEVSRIAAQRWRSMSAEDKQRYEALAEADKQRFDEEMRKYVSPNDALDGETEAGEAEEEEEVIDPGKKAKKSPLAPKGPLSAYFIFTNHIRPMVVLERPDLTLPAVTKEIASRWRAMTPEEKAPYEEKSAMDKRRYQMEMAAFKAGMM